MVTNTQRALINSRFAAGPVTLTWTSDLTNVPTGNLISSFSSFGLTPDLTLKPDVGAPGGSIRSTFPIEQGSYATLSGTSMAKPHTAGGVALLLESRGFNGASSQRAIRAVDVRGVLQNNAIPPSLVREPGFGYPGQYPPPGRGHAEYPGRCPGNHYHHSFQAGSG